MSDEPQPPGRPARRPLTVVVLVLLAVVSAAVVVRLVGGGSGGTADGTADGTAGRGSGAAGAVPTPPASAPARGSLVLSTVGADGVVTVQQWIRGTSPIRSLDLSTVDPQADGAAQALDVRVQGLDGTTLASQASVGSDQVRLRLSPAVPNVYLSYRITDGVADASETVPGRMLVNVLGMDVDYAGSAGGAVQRLVTGPGTVTNVACLRIEEADSAPKPCGAPTADGGWQVALRGIDRTDRLLAQLNSSGSPSGSPSASPSPS